MKTPSLLSARFYVYAVLPLALAQVSIGQAEVPVASDAKPAAACLVSIYELRPPESNRVLTSKSYVHFPLSEGKPIGSEGAFVYSKAALYYLDLSEVVKRKGIVDILIEGQSATWAQFISAFWPKLSPLQLTGTPMFEPADLIRIPLKSVTLTDTGLNDKVLPFFKQEIARLAKTLSAKEKEDLRVSCGELAL